MKRPDLVVFDCDGVLVDSERMEVGTIAEALTWVGCRLDAADLHERNRGGELSNLLALVEDDLAAPLPDWFVTRYRELQFDRLAHVDVVPGAREAVSAAVDGGLARCVVSGGPIGKMRASLGATGLWDAFAPDIYSCYDISDHKPSPGIYLHVISRFGVDAADCLAVEDSATGVAAAAAAGVPVVGLARDTSPDTLLAAGAAFTISTMHEFAALLIELD